MQLPDTPSFEMKFLTEVWAPAERALQDVYLSVFGEKDYEVKVSPAHIMEWYSHIHFAITKDQKIAELLYNKFRSWIETELSDGVIRRLEGAAQLADTDALPQYIAKACDDFKIVQRFGTQMFSSLNYLTKKTGWDSVDKLFQKAFDKAKNKAVTKGLMNSILQQVTAHRDGKQIDVSAVRSRMDLFTKSVESTASGAEATDIYETECESRYLQDLANAYETSVRIELNRDGGHHSYLQWVQSRIDLEEALATEFLQPSSLPKVLELLEKKCLGDQVNTVILHPESGFAALLKDWKDTELRRMFMLFSRIKEAVKQKEAVKLMAGELKKCVILEGEASLKSFGDDQCIDGATNIAPLVKKVVLLFRRYEQLISSHFETNTDSLEALQKGVETFVEGKLSRKATTPNGTETAVKETAIPASDSEVLASYTDDVLGRLKAEAEDERLEKIAIFVMFLKEKDVYQEIYKAKLAKRLLQTKPNLDLERSFLMKLQRSMGLSFTYKMKGMIDDQENTKTIDEEFQQDESTGRLPAEFQCQVLTAGHWPAYNSDALKPPGSLRECMKAFSLFYKKKYATRNLHWLHMLGSSKLLISFRKGPKDVTCSTYQATILCLVDDFGAVSARDIAQNMNLDLGKVVKENIASMHTSKEFPLLVSVDRTGAEKPVEGMIADEDLFKLNPDFQYKLRKFKLPPPSQAMSFDMPTSTEMDAKRKAMMDASIVRVMKSRKELSFNELLELCITQLTKFFSPQPKDIKQRIEDLIGRGYLRRHPVDTTRFEFLA
jgi:hypothetical protein